MRKDMFLTLDWCGLRTLVKCVVLGVANMKVCCCCRTKGNMESTTTLYPAMMMNRRHWHYPVNGQKADCSRFQKPLVHARYTLPGVARDVAGTFGTLLRASRSCYITQHTRLKQCCFAGRQVSATKLATITPRRQMQSANWDDSVYVGDAGRRVQLQLPVAHPQQGLNSGEVFPVDVSVLREFPPVASVNNASPSLVSRRGVPTTLQRSENCFLSSAEPR